jgi:predicted AAA+ superfamily ATPase
MSSHIQRYYQDIEKLLVPGKVLVVYGPRQVGKTTLLSDYLATTTWKYRLDQGDNTDIQDRLSSRSFSAILPIVEELDLYVIDEAQKIPHIGEALKILVDQKPNLRIIATGSSSFELADQIGEPLTGRKHTITLYPISQLELNLNSNRHTLDENLESSILYGSYPRILTAASTNEKIDILTELVDSYLLKDILSLERVKGAKPLRQILALLAHQIGSTVSYNEIATQVSLDVKTVSRYLDLLEKTFVIYSLSGYSSNLRNEVTSQKKYYFYDTGIRNAIIQQFNPLALRADVGPLWENYLMTERLKFRSYTNRHANPYFWRTHAQKEIDLIEEYDGVLHGIEFKWGKAKSAHAKAFLEDYPSATLTTVSSSNYQDFILSPSYHPAHEN